MCSEASFLNSGFGIYNKELLTRLHKTNKYTVAEFASYGFVNDPRDKDIHWTYYANAVKNEDSRHKAYSSRPDNQRCRDSLLVQNGGSRVNGLQIRDPGDAAGSKVNRMVVEIWRH